MKKRPPSVNSVQCELGRRLRAAREAAKLTQEEAAAAAGIDYKRWQRLEQGAVNATVRTLTRAAEAVGANFWTLVSDTGAGPQT